MCDECTWHHKTFLVQSVYWHLAVKLYCIVLFCLKIKNALHRLSDLESEVAENDVLSRRVVENINTNDLIIDGQQADDREQFAKLTKIQTFLEEV